MTSTNNNSARSELSAPSMELNTMSLNETPARRVRSETSLAAMTPPDSTSGGVTARSDAARVTQDDGLTQFAKAIESDDVFITSAKVPTMPKADAERIATRIQQAVHSTNLAITNAAKPAPRADRINDPITPANAQGVLPPAACIFVANLAMAQTDEQLEHSCHLAFDVFGDCLIKVRRDKHRHPFAIVQFYDAQQAADAIKGAQDLVVDGRRIRIEPIQARRTALLVKIGPGCPTIEETRSMLQQYGPIDDAWPTTYGDARRLGVPEGMWVRFTYYLDFKDAIKQFNTVITNFRLHVPVEPAQSTYHGIIQPTPVYQPTRAPRSSTDQKSIFIGNLPVDTTEAELRNIFGHFGTIMAVNVIHKPIHGGTGFNVFAFIEFSDSYEANHAAEQEIDIRGERVRVEPKEYSARRATRLQYHPANTPPSGNRWNNMSNIYSPGHQSQYSSSPSQFYGFSPGPQGYNNTPPEMSPYNHGNGYANNNVFVTPPPMNRIGRRNDMFLGSPGSVQYYSPLQVQYPPTYNMGPIQENYEEEQNY